MRAESCFHCALPCPPNNSYQVDIDGAQRPVCCPGCKAVAELIRDAGFSNYYALRDAPQPGTGRPAEDQAEWALFDTPDMLAAFTLPDGSNRAATIYVGGMYCAACSWLIESTLARMTGVLSADVNPVTHRLRARWNPDRANFGEVLARLAALGYDPQPLAPDSTLRPELVEQRTALKRLLVASLGMMQVMMFAIGLYAGDYQGMEAEMQGFLRLVSFVVTTPVVFYAARPFFAAAWRGLVSRRPGMDLPVSLAVGSAYVASVYATLTGGPAVWYDSVTMFVFFLTLGRFLEMRARHRSIDRGTALSSLLPNRAIRLSDGQQQWVPVATLASGDRVLVRPGDAIPADGTIAAGTTSIDESLLTGEAEPRQRREGDTVVAGSINLDGVFEMRVLTTGIDTTLGAIGRLAERARYARPAFVQLADRIASYIVVAILLVAAGVAGAWYVADPARAFAVTLSVLVVTCPCALALATPAAFAAAGSRLAELRLLVTNGNAIEILSRATTMLFDKTGTLTRGRPVVARVDIVDPAYTETGCLRVAAALESVSTHPLAAAFQAGGEPVTATDQRVVVGEGVEGSIAGRQWRLGRHAFAVAADTQQSAAATAALSRISLACDGRLVARFAIEDELRPGVAETLQSLRSMGLAIAIVSGDGQAAVAKLAADLGIDRFQADCTPVQKLDIIRAAQQRGETVIMVGDGINDAPVLAGADASIAPAHGALLAQTSADIIMLGESLEPLVTVLRAARQTMRVVRQNIAWAIVYNATALPLAALGYVPPWAAAIGMSASSLVVVLNALRLSRYR